MDKLNPVVAAQLQAVRENWQNRTVSKETDSRAEGVKRVLSTIAKVLHNPALADSKVTDASKLYDFTWGKDGEEKDVERIGKELGIQLSSADIYIWEMADSLKPDPS